MATRKTGRGPQSRRTQRRAADRRKVVEQRKKQGPVSAGTIGGIVTALILAAVIAFAAVKAFGSNTSSNGGAITVANDYNPAPSMLKKGALAPNFTLRGVDGGTYTLASQRGRPVFLEFFAVWCPHCQAEAPTIAKLTKNYAPKGLTVWSVLANPYGPNYEGGSPALATKADVDNFARLFNVTHPQLIDPTFKVVNEYGISDYPGLYIINKTGRVSYVNAGETPYKTLATAVDKALKS